MIIAFEHSSNYFVHFAFFLSALCGYIFHPVFSYKISNRKECKVPIAIGIRKELKG